MPAMPAMPVMTPTARPPGGFLFLSQLKRSPIIVDTSPELHQPCPLDVQPFNFPLHIHAFFQLILIRVLPRMQMTSTWPSYKRH